MIPARRLHAVFFFLLSTAVGCGGGSTSTNQPPPSPTITSTPTPNAQEGVLYTYQLTATSPNANPITFSLEQAPAGASLSQNMLSWTPTHAESRIPNSFTVTATAGGGGKATQTWTVTPTGTVNISTLITYWSSSGTLNVPVQLPSNLPYPAALIPLQDGSLQHLQGAQNPDGTFSIPGVPSGYYWLQINPNANFWTPTSDFDLGHDVIGHPLTSGTQATTLFSYDVSRLLPTSQLGDLFISQPDTIGFTFPPEGPLAANSTSFKALIGIDSNIDWSQLHTLYLGQYQHSLLDNITAYTLGPSAILSNLSFTNGATNSIDDTLTEGASASLLLNVKGSEWASIASSSGPGNPSPVAADFSLFVQPFATDRYADPAESALFGPDLLLIRAAPGGLGAPAPPGAYACSFGIQPSATSIPNLGIPPIATDTGFGAILYDDPYSADWPRMFQYCQITQITFPRPNSSAVDSFYVTTKQTTPVPSDPVAPILSPVQSPMINGTSIFAGGAISGPNVTLSWSPPAIGQPTGYAVQVFQVITLPSGISAYGPAGVYYTSKTSVTIPFISANNIYVFSIFSLSDANAKIETSPFRHKIPSAEAATLSAPFVSN